MFCRECGAEIPDDSKHCKECGAKLVETPIKPITNVSNEKVMTNESFFSKNKKNITYCCIGIVIVFFLVGIASFLSNSSDTHDNHFVKSAMEDANISESEFKNLCKPIDYKQLTKNSNKYYGNRTVITGTVLQIMEENDGGIMRVATDGGYDDVVAVIYSGNNNVVDGDTITVYGYVVDDYSYVSQANMHITIPCIDAKYIDE